MLFAGDKFAPVTILKLLFQTENTAKYSENTGKYLKTLKVFAKYGKSLEIGKRQQNIKISWKLGNIQFIKGNSQVLKIYISWSFLRDLEPFLV